MADQTRSLCFHGACCLAGVALMLVGGAAAHAAPALMPMPQSVRLDVARLPTAGALAFVWQGCRSALLDRAAGRFARDVGRLTGAGIRPGATVPIAVSCDVRNGVNEGYRLSVDTRGISLAATGSPGVLRGLATLRQLVIPSGDGFAFSAATIVDQPRFGWRGLMIDVARHFSSIETLRRQIDAMELVKLNVLHLHLSDHEGFRFESRAYPLLTRDEGSRFYTQDQLRALVAYAADRGIRIIPEIDLPGHARAIVRAYPGLTAVPAGTGGGAVAMLGNGAVNPALPQTYQFIDRIIGELASVFPDAYVHVGGDELPESAWKGDPQIESLKQREGLSSHAQVEAYFHGRVLALLKKHGKAAIGWDEIAGDALPKDVVVQAWRSSKQVARVTAYGNPTIVSAGYYLDGLRTTDKYYLIDPLDPTAAGLEPADYETLRRMPVIGDLVQPPSVKDPSVRMSPGQEGKVIGAEAAVWTEIITEEMLDGRIWPRAAAVAERFWSPRDVRDVPDMYRRLATVQDQLRVLGLEDSANQQRMLARLAPGDSQPVETLVAVLNSARIGAVLRPLKAMLAGDKALAATPLEFNVIAAAAPVDSLVARGFQADVAAYLDGQKALAPGIAARLATWRRNHVLFARVATGQPLLEAVLPVSADLTSLAEAGAQALNALEGALPMSREDIAKARALLRRQAGAARASDGVLGSFLTKDAPPTGDVLIAITPGIVALVDRASRRD